MISIKTIEGLMEDLQTALNHLKNGTKPDETWIKDVDWRIYDTRRDLNAGDIDVDVPSNSLTELKNRVEELEDENGDLENTVDELQDTVDELEAKIDELEDESFSETFPDEEI